MRSLAAVVSFGLVLAASSGAETYVVTPDGTGDFPTIQAAVNASVAGDVIELADGIFTGVGNRAVSFLGKAITIRSQGGDPCRSIIDCLHEDRAFLFESGEGPESILQGVTITKGSASRGAGVYCSDGSSPTFADCVFLENVATQQGGGLACRESSPTLTGCEFRGNRADLGAGMECYWEANASLTDCFFTANIAGYGGGGFKSLASAPTVTRCVFEANTCEMAGGAILCGDLTATDCVFLNNTSGDVGGAMRLSGSYSQQLESCIFVGNMADLGGAIECWATHPVFIGCTFFQNSASSAGSGLYCYEDAWASLENTIIAFSPAGEAIACEAGSGATLTCCDIYGNDGGDWIGCIANQSGLAGNISEHPLFCGPEVGDLAIAEYSPCAPFSPPNAECDLIGALPVGCGPASVPEDPVQPEGAAGVTWGRLKSVFVR